MKVLVAGATGALGSPTVKVLAERGHEVFGLTRSEGKAGIIRGLGATPVLGDVLDQAAVKRVIAEVKPDAIAQLLNALPKRGPIRPSEMEATNELRTTGTRYLLGAAIENGVKRFAVESMIFGYGYGDKGAEPLTEEAPYGKPVEFMKVNDALGALRTMEQLVLEATKRGEIEGLVLRLGLFYGPGIGSTEFMLSLLRKRIFFIPGGGKGVLSWIHVEDGAAAIVAALEDAPPGSIYNVVDDEPTSFGGHVEELARAFGVPGPKSVPVALAKMVSSYAAQMATTNLRVSNAKLKRELGWKPTYPTVGDGMAAIASHRG